MITAEDWAENAAAILVPAIVIFGVYRAGKQPLWSEAFRRLRTNRVAVGSLLVLSLYSLVAILGGIGWHSKSEIDRQTVIDVLFKRPVETTYSAPLADFTSEANTKHKLLAPHSHLFGTDTVGEDVFYESLKATHTALYIGVVTTAIATPLALTLGMLGGYFGKFTDDAVQYTYTVFASIPDILLLTAIILMLKPGPIAICIALGVTTWIGLCRLVRGETLRHRDRDYVRAAKALGVHPLRIISRHILPNLFPIVIISVTLSFSSIVLSEAILSYLGVGVGPDTPSWGNMIDAARDELTRDPIVYWNVGTATLGLMGLVLALNLFADALRDAIDPRLRSS